MRLSTIGWTLFSIIFCATLLYANQRDAQYAVVSHVIDGDTFETASGMRVRLIGVDAPELDRTPQRGKRSKRWLRRRIEGREVKLVWGEERTTGPYGRQLCYVYLGDIFINKRLVDLGLAEVAIYQNDGKADELRGL
jgi:micrococcal nuclease